MIQLDFTKRSAVFSPKSHRTKSRWLIDILQRLVALEQLSVNFDRPFLYLIKWTALTGKQSAHVSYWLQKKYTSVSFRKNQQSLMWKCTIFVLFFTEHQNTSRTTTGWSKISHCYGPILIRKTFSAVCATFNDYTHVTAKCVRTNQEKHKPDNLSVVKQKPLVAWLYLCNLFVAQWLILYLGEINANTK